MSATISLADLELEPDCPVCLEKYIPPVFQCKNGHLICHICIPLCQQCPVCRVAMPRTRIRNIAFEKMITRISSTVSINPVQVPTRPCPNRSSGCPLNVSQSDEENHKLDCAFVKKKLCKQIGFLCEEESSGSQMNEMITHFIFDHNLDGCIGDDDPINFDFGTLDIDTVFSSSSSSSSSSNTTSNARDRSSHFELVQTCKKQDLGNYLTSAGSGWTKPNYFKFDDRMFFVIKNVSRNLRCASLVVCTDASLVTREMYYALIGISPWGNNSETSSYLHYLEVRQPKIHLLSQSSQLKFTSEEAQSLQYYQLPFSEIEALCKNSNLEFSWKVHVTIAKKAQVETGAGISLPSSSAAINTAVDSRGHNPPSQRSLSTSSINTNRNEFQAGVQPQGIPRCQSQIPVGAGVSERQRAQSQSSWTVDRNRNDNSSQFQRGVQGPALNFDFSRRGLRDSLSRGVRDVFHCLHGNRSSDYDYEEQYDDEDDDNYVYDYDENEDDDYNTGENGYRHLV